MKTNVVVRQRPAIGDALLLGPLIKQIKQDHPEEKLVVVTNPHYAGGALKIVFDHNPHVDRVESIDPIEWTTTDNVEIDANLRGANTDKLPQTIQKATRVFNCNSAYMQFERHFNGRPPYGIAEFWLEHHGIKSDSALPIYQCNANEISEASIWIAERNPDNKPVVGIVLQAGDPIRDWDYKNKSFDLVTALYTQGILPITIDIIKALQTSYAVPCIGKPLSFIAALLKQCDLVITPDTGLLHLAQAVGTPTIALWGIMPPELRVKNYDTTVVPSQSLGICDSNVAAYCPCCRFKFQQWSCMQRITVPMILRAVENYL